MSNEPHDTANRVAGEILRVHVNLGNDLEYLIMYYLLGFTSNRQNFLRDEILQKLSFQRKVDIFKTICKQEKYDEKLLSEIMNEIKCIQKIRNKVAHWESSYEKISDFQESQIRLWSQKSHKYIDDTIVLNQKLINETSKSYFSIRKELTKVTNYLIDRDRNKDLIDDELLNFEEI